MKTSEVACDVRKYISYNVPPKEILNLGIHGSSTDNISPHSDIDFFCILKNYTENVLKYLAELVHEVNKKTGCWVDMMVGETNNKGVFQLETFTLKSLLKNHVEIHGLDFKPNILTMIRNFNGEPDYQYAFARVKNSGNKMKKALVDLNYHQLLVSKPPFDMKHIKCSPDEAVEIKARTIAKLMLTSCAFAVAAFEILEGREFLFKKFDVYHRIDEYFNLIAYLPERAQGIYYGNSDDFSEFIEDSYGWFNSQEHIENVLRSKIENL